MSGGNKLVLKRLSIKSITILTLFANKTPKTNPKTMPKNPRNMPCSRKMEVI